MHSRRSFIAALGASAVTAPLGALQRLGKEMMVVGVRTPEEFNGAFAQLKGWKAQALLNADDNCRGSAAYVDRILKGAKPSELPVQQPVKFEFVINLQTAKALSVGIPPAVLLRVDRVIE